MRSLIHTIRSQYSRFVRLQDRKEGIIIMNIEANAQSNYLKKIFDPISKGVDAGEI